MIRVFITDDHEIYLEGLALLLSKQEGIEVTGTATTGKGLLECVQKGLQADILLLDVYLPDMPEEEIIQQIRASHPDLRVIYLTLLRGTRYVHKLAKYNIQGYILKNASLEELLGALRSRLEAAFISHDPAELQARRNRAASQRQRRFSRAYAATALPDIDIDDNIERRLRGGERFDRIRVIDSDRHVGIPGQLYKMPDLQLSGDLVGDENWADAVPHERIRLGQSGAGDSNGPGSQLTLRELRALMVLVMRAQPGRPAFEVTRHAREIALHGG